MKILVVEDEKNISRFIELQLMHEGYETDTAYDGREAMEKITKVIGNGGEGVLGYDLILLDIMIPNLNGFEITKKVRAFSDIPIILVTAKDETTDKVIGLDLGADDYITKPFVTEELMARIRVALRKRHCVVEKPEETLELYDLSINLTTREVKRNNISIELSKTEYDLLEYMVRNKGIVLSRNKILNAIWGYDYFGNDNILDVYIKYLRDKVEKPFDKKILYTVRGVGFIIK